MANASANSKQPRWLLYLCIPVLLGSLYFVANSLSSFINKQNEQFAWRAPQREYLALSANDLKAPAGEHHKALDLIDDIPGVSNPTLVERDVSTVKDRTEVIGVVIENQAYAFPLSRLKKVNEHIINFISQGQSMSVTYCDIADCARVLTNGPAEKPTDLRIGGLDMDEQLVFLFQGVRYGQTSKAIPLEDYPFERTTFEAWCKKHPKTLIYEGKIESQFDLIER